VLDVKLRSDQVRASRLRMAALTSGLLLGTLLGLYLFWRVGEWTLNGLVFENPTFAIQQIEVQTDGVIAPDQLRRWTGVRPGQNLMALDLASVKRNLELVSVIGSVSVERVLPRTLRIRITEREPVAQVHVLRAGPGGNGLEVAVFQLDAAGYVLEPLDPRQRATLPVTTDDALPTLSGVNPLDLKPGHPLDSPPVQAALHLIDAFDHSPMAGLVDLRRIDVSSPEVIVVTTSQESEVTFGLDDLDQQLRRWRKIYDECLRRNKSIATLDLAVADNTPARLVQAGSVPPSAPKSVKPPRVKGKNV